MGSLWHRGSSAPLVSALLVSLAALCLAALVVSDARAASRAPLWIREWTPPRSDAVTTVRLARSATGDLYVAGQLFRRDDRQFDVVVARFTTDGARTWVRTLGGPSSEQVRSLAADDDGNVAVVGLVATGSAWSDTDWFVAVWNRAGKLKWQHQVDGSAHGYDSAWDVVAGSDGSFYVVGQRNRVGHSDDGVLVRYSPRGKALWTRYVDGAFHGSDGLYAVAHDAKGNIYATGYEYDAGILTRYRRDGTRDWLYTWDEDPSSSYDSGRDLAVRGSVLAVAGVSAAQSASGALVDRAVTLRYATSGARRWSRLRANDTPSLPTSWSLVDVDGAGRVAVAGLAGTDPLDSASSAWITTVYSAGGDPGALHTLQGDAVSNNYPAGLASAADGSVYETGSTGSLIATQSLFVVAVGQDGAERWTSRPIDPALMPSEGGGIVATPNAVYVAGRAGAGMVLLRYRP